MHEKKIRKKKEMLYKREKYFRIQLKVYITRSHLHIYPLSTSDLYFFHCIVFLRVCNEKWKRRIRKNFLRYSAASVSVEWKESVRIIKGKRRKTKFTQWKYNRWLSISFDSPNALDNKTESIWSLITIWGIYSIPTWFGDRYPTCIYRAFHNVLRDYKHL